MKPLSLTFQAFGSYAGELHVDFSRLSRHGIFAISGPTGAGKSTIFDALVYALYDDLPGFRVDGNVRSQFADASIPTWVSLDFVVHGEVWRLDRRPAQLVRAPRGGGALRAKDPRGEGAIREKKSTAVLGRVGDDGELVPGTAVTRKSEVKRRIDGLVGLTKDQFEQVVLIPQGRFEEVLKADTAKRAPLLQRLFPVEVFTRVTEHLKSVASARQVDFDEASRAYAAVTERLQRAYDAALEQLPDEVRASLLGADLGVDAGEHASGAPRMKLLDRHLEVLNEGVRRVDGLVATQLARAEQARARAEDARHAAADWDQWQEDIALSESFDAEERCDIEEVVVLDRARRLGDLRGALTQWEEGTLQLETYETELGELVDAVGSAWPDELDASGWGAAREDAHEAGLLAERLAADARRLDGEIGRFERLVEAGAALGARRSVLGERRIELAERELKLDAEEQALSLVADEVQALRSEAAGLDAHAGVVAALEREHELASRRAGAAAEAERLGAELATATAAAAWATERAEAVRTSWREGLAGRLAQLLVDGAPCPTCGALDHPAPARWRGDRADGSAPDLSSPDDSALDDAERAQAEALRLRSGAERRAASALGVMEALAQTRPLDAVEADLAACRAALLSGRDAAERLAVVAAEEGRRGCALREARDRLGSDAHALDADGMRLDADATAHERASEEFVQDHGGFESPAPRAAARTALAAGVERLARLLRGAEAARAALRHCRAVLEPLAHELGAGHPDELLAWVLEPGELEARSAALEVRRSRRAEVRRRIADYEGRAGSGGGVVDAGLLGVWGPHGAWARPDVGSLEAAAEAAASEHVALAERRAVLYDRVAALAAGPSDIAESARAVDAARAALEQAKSVADRCAGSAGGPAGTRLSLESWVLADYLRQVLVQANQRLDAMTAGRFALELCDGVTDGRKPWGLDLAVFDANTGQVRPATTLSGGETFMAALALSLGLADVVSGGSNREVGALFVDEGFGSLDSQSLDAVIEVLRSLEDGGRIVGVVSHVRELQRALPCGITVEPSAGGSLATVHYPAG